jgi:hypothetical protein
MSFSLHVFFIIYLMKNRENAPADPPWVFNSASGGYPGTKTQQNVPADPPWVMLRAQNPRKTCPLIRLRGGRVKATEFLQEWGGKTSQ